MRVEFFERERRPEGILADAEIYFDAVGADGEPSAFHGIKITGISIRSGNEGPWVSFPSREYSKDGKRKWFDYVQSADRDDRKPVFRLKSWIMDEYRAYSSKKA